MRKPQYASYVMEIREDSALGPFLMLPTSLTDL